MGRNCPLRAIFRIPYWTPRADTVKPLTAIQYCVSHPQSYLSFIMDIQIASLCDFAADYQGKLVVTGVFDTLAARAMPVVHPHCALALRFCFTPEDAGRHKLSIIIIDEDGNALDPKNMPIEPEFDVALPKNVPFLTRNLILNLQGLRFPTAGIYSVDIGCDGEVMQRIPLRILQVNAEGKPVN